METGCCSRRDVLAGGLGCGAFVALSLAGLGAGARRAFAQESIGKTVATKPFGRVERLAEGVWAAVATPSGGREMICNGGIVAGKDRVLVIEACMTEAGARFLADIARELTGRFPTHVVVTHFHRDHTSGLMGFLRSGSEVSLMSTAKTRELLGAQYQQSDGETSDGMIRLPQLVLPNAVLSANEKPTEIDLGGRVVRLVPRIGHTPSDVTIEIDEPRIVWTGDLVFNGLFPNYGDAIPSKLRATCEQILHDKEATFVPGHGPLAMSKELKSYLGLLEDVERAARSAHEQGVPASAAWKAYEIPPSLGEWAKYRPDVYRFAFEAWERELAG